MTTQVIFKIDQKLKAKAMKKAQSQGIPFSSILKYATEAYVDGELEVGLIQKETLNAKTRKELIKIHNDIKKGKNMSPAFHSAKEGIAYLESI